MWGVGYFFLIQCHKQLLSYLCHSLSTFEECTLWSTHTQLLRFFWCSTVFIVQTKISLHQLQGVQWYYHTQKTRSCTSLPGVFWVAQEEKRGSVSEVVLQVVSIQRHSGTARCEEEELPSGLQEKTGAGFFTFLWKSNFPSITQVYVCAWESHMVFGEVKGDSVPDRGDFYTLFSGTRGGKGSQRTWCQV